MHLVITKPTPLSSVASSAPQQQSAYDKMMSSRKPKARSFESKFDTEAVNKFLEGYASASNKETYLKSFKKGEKPSITDQIEAIVVDFLNGHGIQCKDGTGGEKQRAVDGLKQLVKVVMFLARASCRSGEGPRK